MPAARIQTPAAPLPGGPYSQAIRHGDLLVVSGQVGLHAQTGEVPPDFDGQCRVMFDNLAAILDAGGAAREDVIKTTCFLVDISDFPEFNEHYAAFFGAHRPARSTVGVQLFGPYVVEIEAIAVMDANS